MVADPREGFFRPEGVSIQLPRCSIHENRPVDLRQITWLKDRIAQAAAGKSFLIFNGCIDGSIDESNPKYETCDDMTMEFEAARHITRPITCVHQYSFPFMNMDLINHQTDQEMDRVWDNILVTNRYVSRFFLGVQWEEHYTVFDDKVHNYSTHMLHIRYEEKLNDHDIAYLSKIENPISVEIRKDTKVDELLEKCKLLKPENAKGALVVIVHPYKGMCLSPIVKKFIAANVKATWVVSPVLISPTSDPRTFVSESLYDCRDKLSLWHVLLLNGGAQFGGLLLETRVKDAFVSRSASGLSESFHHGHRLAHAKHFLLVSGRVMRIAERHSRS